MLIGDTETNGLMPDVSVIHCAVFYDIPTDIWTEFTPDTVHLIPEFLDTQPELCMHNGIGFDLQVYEKILKYKYKGKFRDSLLMSRVLWPDKTRNRDTTITGKEVFCKAGPHSVENWALQFRMHKPEHNDWTQFSPEMLLRCKEDVKVQTKMYLFIQKYIKLLQTGDKRLNDLENVWNMEQRVWEIIEQQTKNGWTLDINKAYNCVEALTEMLNQIDSELIPTLPTKMVSAVKTENKVVKAFTGKNEISSVASKWLGGDIKNLAGDFCKVEHKIVNLNAPAQVKDFLLSVGWKPTKYNFKKDKFNKPIRDDNRNLIHTTPKIPDSVEEWEVLSKKLNHPAVSLMANRGRVKHRLGAIKGYIENVSPDGRLRGSVNTCSCNTTRMTHKVIVNVPKASEKKFYGKEMRSLFTASKGLVMVGCDASALEARCEAHYIYPYDKESAKELIEGDVHSKNAVIFQTDRDLAKSGKYAILYGCSAGKLADTLNKPVQQCKVIYEAYWRGNPGLKRLKEELVQEWKQFGYLLAVDGRPLTIRYEHALINTLFQSCGSIAMKIALCWLDKKLKEKGYRYWHLGNFHDEFQLECYPEEAEEIGKLMVKSIQMAGKILKMNVGLDAEYAIGQNWSLTH